MATNYPSSLDNFTNPTNGDKLDSPSHSLQHADANDALEAIETKLGIGASAAGSAVAGYSLIHEAGGTTSWGPIVSIDGGSTILSTDADIEPLILQGGTPEIATVGSVSANGTTITYTASNTFSAGQAVRITGVNPAQFNFDRAVLATAGTGNFTVTNAGTGTYVSGGTAILYQGNLQEWKDYQGNVVASVDQFGKSNLGGLVHINTTTFSAVASQSVDNVFTSDYDSYRIIVVLTGIQTSFGELRLKLRNNTTDDSTNYYRTSVRVVTTTVSGIQDAGVTTGWQVLEYNNARNTTSYNSVIELNDPVQNSFTTGNVMASYFSSADNRQIHIGGLTHETTGSFNGINLITSAGSVTGRVSIYGYAKA